MTYSTGKTSTKQPVTVVAGLLGSGKTTLLQSLLAQQAQGQKWGLLINDFGSISIDALFLEKASHVLMEIAGGCLCCSAQHVYRRALNQVAQQSLDRVVIEISGLGHPSHVVDILQEPENQAYFFVQRVVAVVTPQQLAPVYWSRSQLLRDTVHLADTVVLTHTQTSTQTEIDTALACLASLYPAKSSIRLPDFRNGFYCVNDPYLLSNPPLTFANNVPQKTDTTHPDATNAPEFYFRRFDSTPPLVGNPGDAPKITPSPLPECLETHWQPSHPAVLGWRWSPKVQFNRTRLIPFFEKYEPFLLRAKGALRTGREWQRLDWTESSKLELTPLAWRHDNRLELLLNASETDLRNQIETDLRETYLIRD